MKIIIDVIVLLLPAAFANASAPIFAKAFPKLNYPLDFNQKIRGIRILGNHKTIRGLVGGTLIGGITYLVELVFVSQTLTDLPFYYGFAIGFSALLGDAIKSFFKRQIGIAPGKSWFPFDQIDWTLSSCIVISLWINVSILFFIMAVFLSLLAYFISKYLGWKLGINEVKF